MTFKLAAALLPALFMFTATAKADVTAADLTSEAPVLEDAALEAAKANPPKGCIQAWAPSLAAKTHATESATWQGQDAEKVTVTEDWTLVVTERFLACYIDDAYLTASTESVAKVTCANSFYRAGGLVLGADDPQCNITCGARTEDSPPCT